MSPDDCVSRVDPLDPEPETPPESPGTPIGGSTTSGERAHPALAHLARASRPGRRAHAHGSRDRRGGLVAQRRVRPAVVVVELPPLQLPPRLGQRRRQLAGVAARATDVRGGGDRALRRAAARARVDRRRRGAPDPGADRVVPLRVRSRQDLAILS